jgi:hypothetical protein
MLGVALIVCVVLLCIPTTAVRNFWDAVTGPNSVITPSSDLYQTLLTKIHQEDALYVSPGSLFAGGLVFGRLIPLRFSRLRAVSMAAATAAGVYFACAAFVWFLDAFHSGYYSDWRSALVSPIQLIAIGMATAAAAIGTVIGVIWRDSRSAGAIQ